MKLSTMLEVQIDVISDVLRLCFRTAGNARKKLKTPANTRLPAMIWGTLWRSKSQKGQNQE